MNEIDYQLYYRTWHDESEAHFELSVAQGVAALGPLLPSGPRAAAIDVGCGMGFSMGALRQLGYQSVQGIDVDRGQIESCLKRGLRAELVADSAVFLREHEGAFDLVTMLDVLEHVPVASQIPLMQEVTRSLKPGGRVIVRVPNANSPLAARWRYNDSTHHCSFTEHSLHFVLANARLHDIRIGEDHGPYGGGRSLKSALWALRRTIVRWAWRQVLASEYGRHVARSIPISLNLLATADRKMESGKLEG